MLKSPNPTLLELLQYNATITFPDGSGIETRIYTEPISNTQHPYIVAISEGGKTWGYDPTPQNLETILKGLGHLDTTPQIHHNEGNHEPTP